MKKRKIIAMLLTLAIATEFNGVAALAGTVGNQINESISNSIILENKSITDIDTLYDYLNSRIEVNDITALEMIEIINTHINIIDSIVIMSDYINDLDDIRKYVFGDNFINAFKLLENKENMENSKVLESVLYASMLSTEASKYMGNSQSGSAPVEIYVSEDQNGIIDITEDVFQMVDGQVKNENVEIKIFEDNHDSIIINDNSIKLDTSNITQDINITIAFQLTSNYHGCSSTIQIKIIAPKVITEIDKLYDEVESYIDSEDYSNMGLTQLLQNKTSVIGELTYIKELDDTRKEVFGSTFKSKFQYIINNTNYSKNEILENVLGLTIVNTEASKYMGNESSNTKVVEVTVDKQEYLIDITEEVFQLEKGQNLIDGINTTVVSVGGLPLEIQNGRVMLDARNTYGGNQTVYFKLNRGEYFTQTSINVKVKVNDSTSQIDKLYKCINDYISKPTSSDFGLTQMLKQIPEATALDGLREYITPLNNAGEETFGKRFKYQFIKEDQNASSKENVLKTALAFAKPFTEASKLQGHYESRVGFVRVEQKRENTEPKNIYEEVFALVDGQTLEEGTTITVKSADNSAITIKDNEILLDASKLAYSFNSTIEFVLTNGNSSTHSNINLIVDVPKTTDEDIVIPEDNTPVIVVPEVNEDKTEVVLGTETIDKIIESNSSMKIEDTNTEIVLPPDLLKELNQNVEAGSETLKITIEDVKEDVISKLPSTVKPIGNVSISTNTSVNKLNGKFTMKVKVGNSVAKSNYSSSTVYVYSVVNGKTTLIQSSTKDSQGYVEFRTSSLGDVIITDKRISTGGGGNPTPPPVVDKAPVITATDIEIVEGEEFDPLAGVKASDVEDGDITKSVKVIENTVDASKAGTYKVVYEVKDSYGHVVTKEIKVVVKTKLVGMNNLPTITAKDITIKLGTEFNPLSGVTAVDEEDGDLTSNIKVIKNTVDINKEGAYEVVYEVVDSSKGKTTKTITVTIKSVMVEEVYEIAYNSVVNAMNGKTQISINKARKDIDTLKNEIIEHGDLGLLTLVNTLSSELDKVQGPIYVTIVDKIMKMKSAAKVTQSEINEIRIMLEGTDELDKSDDVEEAYAVTWHTELDKMQEDLYMKMINAVEIAETEQTRLAIDRAQMLVTELSTAVRKDMKDLAAKYQERLNNIK